MNNTDGADPRTLVWDKIIYLPTSQAMEQLGFSALQQSEPALYAKLSECLVALAASKRFMNMAVRLNGLEERDAYFAKSFPLAQSAALMQKRASLTDQEKMFFDYEVGVSVLYNAYCKAVAIQNETVSRATEDGIRAVAGFYRDQFHYTSFKFHNAMFGAETIEMDSPAALGLKLMDKAYAQDKKAWNNFAYHYLLKDPAYIEELFWKLVLSYAPYDKMKALRDLVPASDKGLASEPVEVAAHSGSGYVPFWAGSPKSRVNA